MLSFIDREKNCIKGGVILFSIKTAEDAGILTDSEDDNAVMRNLTQQMLKSFI